MSSGSSERMRKLLIDLVRPLITRPEDLRVESHRRGSVTVLELRVHKDDMGKVIGRGGRRAEAIRSVMQAQASRLHSRVLVDILD